jgi:hypothetical protein
MRTGSPCSAPRNPPAGQAAEAPRRHGPPRSWDESRRFSEILRGRGNGPEKVHLNFAHLDSPYPCLVILAQSRTERILADVLGALGVRVERPVALTSLRQDADGVTSTLRHPDGQEETCRAPFVIGCDGAHSTVRKQLGLSFTGEALFHVSSRLVERLRVGRVLVAGDAAHIHSPVGGQGMNTGMQDAFNLGWKLALGLRGRGGEALLDSYHGERHPNAMTLLRATERATRAMIGQGFVASVVRAAAMTVLGNFDFVRDKVALGLSELPVGYRGSPLCVESGPGGMEPHAGDRAPDAEGLSRFPGQTRRLFRWWGQDLQHQLLVFAGPDPTRERVCELLQLVREINSEHTDLLNAVLVRPGTGKARDVPVLFDPRRQAHDRYGAPEECLVLVRPDGYIGFRVRPADGEALRRHLGAVYGP